MDSSELDSLRDAIMECLQKYPRGISTDNLSRLLIRMTFELPESGADSLDAQLTYLEGKELIKKVEKEHTPSAEIWKLTPEGDDYLRTRFRK